MMVVQKLEPSYDQVPVGQAHIWSLKQKKPALHFLGLEAMVRSLVGYIPGLELWLQM
jgi:hypothetical protein